MLSKQDLKGFEISLEKEQLHLIKPVHELLLLPIKPKPGLHLRLIMPRLILLLFRIKPKPEVLLYHNEPTPQQIMNLQ